MNTEQKNKLDLFKKAATHQKPERIPTFSNDYTWKIVDSEYTLTEALTDYDKYTEVQCKFHEKYDFDAYINYAGFRNPFSFTKSLGSTHYVVDDENMSINIVDTDYLMQEDEYPQYMQNPAKFNWEVAIARKHPALLQDDNLEKFHKAVKEWVKMDQCTQNLVKIFDEKYHLPRLFPYGDLFCGGGTPFPSCNDVNSFLPIFYRGMKGLLVDLRRQTKTIDKIFENEMENIFKPAYEGLKQVPYGTNPDAIYDGTISYLAENYFNVKQFDKYVWSWLKPSLELYAEKGKLLLFNVEGKIDRFADHLQELPNKSSNIVMILENDNIFEMKKMLPNITFCGGMPCRVLYNGTKQENIDYAKKLIDEVGYDGAYVFSQDKMVSFKNDCNPENLKAVIKYVKENGSVK